MDIVPFIAAFLGFFAFTLVWGRVMQWILSIWTVIQDRRRNPAKRSPARILVPLLLASGPWVLIIFVGLSVYFFSKPHDPAWNGFFWGALLVPPVVALNVLIFLRRRRRALGAKRRGV
ncbi:MAG: hypothetical protein ACHQ1H_02425 [Nitrososphaerales archaeon]